MLPKANMSPVIGKITVSHAKVCNGSRELFVFILNLDLNYLSTLSKIIYLSLSKSNLSKLFI